MTKVVVTIGVRDRFKKKNHARLRITWHISCLLSRPLQSELKTMQNSTAWDDWCMLKHVNFLKLLEKSEKWDGQPGNRCEEPTDIFQVWRKVMSIYHYRVTFIKLQALLYKLLSTKHPIPQSIFHLCGTPQLNKCCNIYNKETDQLNKAISYMLTANVSFISNFWNKITQNYVVICLKDCRMKLRQ